MHVDDDITLLPTLECWGNVSGDMDISEAANIFLGKTKDEIEPLLNENYIMRCLDLAHMPDRVFGYYALGFAEFAINKVDDEEWFPVIVGSFLEAISRRRKYSPLYYKNFLQQALPLLNVIFDKIKRSRMDLEIKDDLLREFEACVV